MPDDIDYLKAVFELNQDERIVLAKIYEYHFEKKEKLWFTKLAELLKNDMLSKKLMRILNKLGDLGYITHQYGETERGRAGRLILIDEFESPLVEDSRKIYMEESIKEKKYKGET